MNGYLGDTFADMGNPYRDVTRLATEPAAVEEYPGLAPGDERLLGIAVPYVVEAIPVTLTPGYEYRIRQVPTAGDGYWVIERRHV